MCQMCLEIVSLRRRILKMSSPSSDVSVVRSAPSVPMTAMTQKYWSIQNIRILSQFIEPSLSTLEGAGDCQDRSLFCQRLHWHCWNQWSKTNLAWHAFVTNTACTYIYSRCSNEDNEGAGPNFSNASFLATCKLLVKDCCWGKMDRVPVRPAAISCLTGKKLIGPVQRRGLFQEAPGFFLSKWYRCVRGKTCLIDATVFFEVPESWFANTSISFGDVFFAKRLDFNQFSGLRFSFQECTLRCACWSDISFSVKLCICMLPKLVYRACVTVASSFAASDIQIPWFSRRMQMLNSRRGAVNSF